MNLYIIALFVHVVGVICVFVGIGTWLFGFAVLWRARSVAQVRDIARLMVWSGYVAVAGVFLVIAGGLYMALAVWGWRTGWIEVATVSFLLVGFAGTFIIDPRVRGLAARTRDLPDGPLSQPLATAAHDPMIGTGLQVYIAVLFGIVFLMTVKPSLANSVIAMVVAVALGVVSSLPLWRAIRAYTVPGPS
jgi:hypothetical protein